MKIPTIAQMLEHDTALTLVEIVRGTGWPKDKVLAELGRLFRAGQIGQCQTTRRGVEGYYYYWR